MNLTTRNNIYFVGIGGIGMSAIAQYFMVQGKNVFGYDRHESALTRKLVAKGAKIQYQDKVEEIDQSFLNVTGEDAYVIYTPAIPKDCLVLNYFHESGYEVIKRAKALGEIVQDKFSIAVAGTHGKTTTSSIIAHILKEGKGACNAFLGGIATNYDSNLLFDLNAEYTVLEADEFDRSFLQLSPNVAVITSTDADHLDIYNEAGNFLKAFQDFSGKIKRGGAVFLNDQIDYKSFNISVQSFTYGFSEQADYRINDLKISDGKYHFVLQVRGQNIESLTFNLPGKYNVENAAAALAVAHHLTVPEDRMRAALASFNGVKRRFEYHIREKNLVFIDDYAHHPSEIRACISAVRDFYPGRKLTGIFQPHLFSRTRDFLDDFAHALSELDELILLDIYPAREKPLPGISSEVLLERIELIRKSLLTKTEIVEKLNADELDVVLTMGAGDIDELIEPIAQKLNEQIRARVA